MTKKRCINITIAEISTKVELFNQYSDYQEILDTQNELIKLFVEARESQLDEQVLYLLSETQDLLELCLRPQIKYRRLL